MKTTLLITTYNRGHLLKNSLERLAHLTIPDDILIISDGCSDNTIDICQSFRDRLPVRCIYNHNPQLSICSFARNVGIRNTDADIIITSEPEIIFVTDVIKQMLKLHGKKPNAILNAATCYIMGNLAQSNEKMIADPENFLNESIVVDWDHREGAANGFLCREGWCGTFTGLYTRDWLLAANGWDENFPAPYGMDDIDLKDRLKIQGDHDILDFREIKILHQWHTPVDVGSTTQKNIDYVHAKDYCRLNYLGPDDHIRLNRKNDFIANQDHEWGKLQHNVSISRQLPND